MSTSPLRRYEFARVRFIARAEFENEMLVPQQRRARTNAKIGGVYVLRHYDNDVGVFCYYVGQSVNVFSRIGGHRKQRSWEAAFYLGWIGLAQSRETDPERRAALEFWVSRYVESLGVAVSGNVQRPHSLAHLGRCPLLHSWDPHAIVEWERRILLDQYREEPKR